MASQVTVIPHPVRPTATSGPTSIALPGYIPHRIGVRVVNGVGEFYDRETGEKFIPRGYNYVRLSPIFGTSGQSWEETLNPGYYDPNLAEGEQTALWDGSSDRGVINDALAPANRPDPYQR